MAWKVKVETPVREKRRNSKRSFPLHVSPKAGKPARVCTRSRGGAPGFSQMTVKTVWEAERFRPFPGAELIPWRWSREAATDSGIPLRLIAPICRRVRWRNDRLQWRDRFHGSQAKEKIARPGRYSGRFPRNVDGRVMQDSVSDSRISLSWERKHPR